MNKYKYDKYKNIIGVEGEEKTPYDFYYNIMGLDFRLMITREKDYYNFYIINDIFKNEPFNNLDIQEPKENFDTLTLEEIKRLCTERVFSFYLWYKYNRSYSIDSEPIEE